MRVELTNDVTHCSRRLLVLGARFEAQLTHGINNASLHRLEPVTNVRQGTIQNHIHRIVEVSFLRIVLKRKLLDICRRLHQLCHDFGALFRQVALAPLRTPASALS